MFRSCIVLSSSIPNPYHPFFFFDFSYTEVLYFRQKILIDEQQATTMVVRATGVKGGSFFGELHHLRSWKGFWGWQAYPAVVV